MTDVKLRVEATNSFYYPDVMVSCEKYAKNSSVVLRPVLVVEVLSRSTAAIDRREKMFAYRKIDSLSEYLIVYQNQQKVELHRRDRSGEWMIAEFGSESEVTLEAIPVGPLKLSLQQIYEDIDWRHDDALEVREDADDDYDEEIGLDW
jgi:Uma2 family endonuclease